MSEENEIRVNFGKPMPIFPLASVTLMPHAVAPMHIFEPRYRQMISDALDGAGQIAMAIFEGETWREEYEASPPVRGAVCVGQIVQHQRLADGRYNVALHGVCRAKILCEAPEEPGRLYRMAMLEPVGLDAGDDDVLRAGRARFIEMLESEPLSHMTDAATVVRHLKDDSLPMSAIMELVTCSLLRDAEMRYYAELHYRLLEEGDAAKRCACIQEALMDLQGLLLRATPQRGADVPRGCNWN